MSIFSSLMNLIKKIVKKVIDLVKKLFKKFWPLLLVVALIYFAPVIAPFLTQIGLPTLGSFFSSIATTVTPALTEGLSWAWSGVSKAAKSGWTAFSGLSLGTQASVVAGAAALIAPEETADLLSEVVSTVGDGLASLISAIPSSVWWLAGGALALWWLWPAERGEKVVLIPSGKEGLA